MPLPHTTCITKPTQQHFFFFFFSVFFPPTFSSPFVSFISPLSLFSSTHIFTLSSFKFQHLSVKKVSIPLNYYFIKRERVRKIKMENREILANPKKIKNNKERERERWLPVIDWRLIKAEQTKGRYCIREDFSIFRCF